MKEQQKIFARSDSRIALKLIQGHFATSQSHITHYLDMTTMKTRCSEASQIAKVLSTKYEVSTPVDTIVCLDGLEVVGTYLAENLKKAGVLSMNAHKTIYVVTPEFHPNGQILFRDNLKPMIKGKNVVILIGFVTTGVTLAKAIESIVYYGGHITGVSAIFSNISRAAGIDVDSVFTKKDLPSYGTYKPSQCPACARRERIEALVNSYGYSEI